MTADPWFRVERMLDLVHVALITGDLAALPSLAAEIEAAVPGEVPIPAAMAGRLRAKADRNARCLEAAGRGLRAARKRLSDITAARGGLSTYDGSGQRHVLAADAGGTARRC
ncbi:MAG: hypothetical protein KF887_00110 [Paracoccaceae bacterium]|nr:MAG: hypothetical protein KF887_00110 [Paracoccaceae bacterium]